MISHRPNLTTLVPVYCEQPAAFTKAGAVRTIIRGNLTPHVRGKGNRARRRQICIELMRDPMPANVLTESDVDLLHDLMTEARTPQRNAAAANRNFHD